MTRAQLQAELDKLDAALPALKAQCTDDNGELDDSVFWPEFAGMADSILDEATSDDYDWVTGQTDALLKKHDISTGWPESP